MEDIKANENIEIDLLLDSIYLKYGYDFRNYSKTSIRRRILKFFEKSGLKSISEMQNKLLYDIEFFNKILHELTLTVTTMFRDPSFFVFLKNKIIPILKSKPFIKIWHAGCSTGEEVYSMAILLKEEKLDHKCLIYATDTKKSVLNKAKKGIFDIEKIPEFTKNYIDAQGKHSFSNYYIAKYNYAIIRNIRKDNLVFSNHDLVTDGIFGELDMIICRNVLIYFNNELQEQIFRLFDNSLSKGGFLCLGSMETLQFSSVADQFKIVSQKEKIYKKNRQI